MPTPQDLHRLRGLLTQLTAIGSVQRGELIRAENWNSLVASVTNVAQAVLSAEVAPAVPPHEHPDQVTSNWLAPQLREVFEKGPLADPATQSRLIDFDQRLKRLSESLDAMSNRVNEFRGRLTDVVTRDLEREAAVTKVQRTVDNVIDPRPALLGLRQTLASVQRDIGNVLQAAAKFTVHGQVVDLGTMVDRVDQLEQFRERLRFSNGELLDAATVESRLTASENKLVSHDELDQAIKNRPLDVPAEVLQGIEDRLGTNLRGEVSQSLEAFATQIRTETSNRLDAVGNLVTSRLNDALPEVARNLTNSLNASIAAAQKSAVETAAADAAKALDALNRSIRADFDGFISQVKTGVATAVRSEVATQLAVQLDGVRVDISTVSNKLSTVTTQVSRHEETLNSHAVPLAALPQDQANLKNDLRTSLLGEIELRFSQANLSLQNRLTEFGKAQNDRIAALTGDLQKIATDMANTVAVQTALAQTKDLRTQLLAEMRAVAREEMNVAVKDRVKTVVTEEVKTQFAVVPGMVATEVQRVNTRPTVTRTGAGGIVIRG